MTIEYDEDRKRATHVETGMAVEFDHECPYPMERTYFFKLFFDGKIIPFDVGYDFGMIRYEEKYPNMEFAEKRLKIKKSNIFDIYINNFKPGIDHLRNIFPEFPEIFVELVFVVVSKIKYTRKVSVNYRPYFQLDRGEWKIES